MRLHISHLVVKVLLLCPSVHVAGVKAFLSVHDVFPAVSQIQNLACAILLPLTESITPNIEVGLSPVF